MKYIIIILIVIFMQTANSQTLISTESFDTDVLIHGSTAPGTVWFAPDYNLPIDYQSTGGCTGGCAGYSGNWNNYWMNFLRTPSVDCSGLDTVILYFEMSNSYDASHVNNKVYFNMWIENSYHDAVVNQTIYFDSLRDCQHFEVVYDLTPYTNKTGVYFYLNALSAYNDSHIFQLKFDNIGLIGNGEMGSCAPFAGNDTAVCGYCFDTANAFLNNISDNCLWSVLSTPAVTAYATIACSTCVSTSLCVNEPGLYEFILEESNGTCTDYDTVVVEFLEYPIISAGNDTTVCKGDMFYLNGMSAGFSGYWETSTCNIQITDTNNAYTSVVIDTSGSFGFVWHEENQMCIATDTVVIESVICSVSEIKNSEIQINAYSSDNDIRIEYDDFYNKSLFLEIFSLNGRKIFNGYINDNPVIIRCDNGLYIIKIVYENQIYKNKVFVNNKRDN